MARTFGFPEDPILHPQQMKSLPEPLLRAFGASTPLFFYVLKEAEVLSEGRRLGPVGGRIVAEVLIGLLRGDPSSYLSVRPLWRPKEGEFGAREHGIFTVADLLRFARGRHRRRHGRGRPGPPESALPRRKGERGERLDRDGNRARPRRLEPPDAICRQPARQGHGPPALRVVGPEPRPRRALRQSGGNEEDGTDQRVLAAGPCLGVRPGPDLPRRPPRRRGSVRESAGGPPARRRHGDRHPNRKHRTDHPSPTEPRPEVCLRPHGVFAPPTERFTPGASARNRGRSVGSFKGHGGPPRCNHGRSRPLAERPSGSAIRLRHDGHCQWDEGPSQDPLLLLAGGSLGLHRRPADRRRPPDPPWKGPRPRGVAAGSRLRAPSLPRRSRSGGTWSARPWPTPDRIAGISQVTGKSPRGRASASVEFREAADEVPRASAADEPTR